MFLFREGLREVPQMAGLFKGVTDQDFVDIGAYFARQTAAARRLQARSEAARARRGDREGHGLRQLPSSGLPRPEACAAPRQSTRGLSRRGAEGVSRQQAHGQRYQHERRALPGTRRRHPGAGALSRPSAAPKGWRPGFSRLSPRAPKSSSTRQTQCRSSATALLLVHDGSGGAQPAHGLAGAGAVAIGCGPRSIHNDRHP